MEGNFLTTRELAAYYRVTKQAIALWRNQGMPFTDLGTRTKRYELEKVEAWLKSRSNKKEERY